MITIVNYGVGNVGSIANMLRKCEVPVTLADTPDAVAAADKLILPGIGAFSHGMRLLRERGMVAALDRAVGERGVPILGICLGMQLFGTGSAEGDEPGLGWIDAASVRFDFTAADARLRVPHMGWNLVAPARAGLLPDEGRYYFVHSYHLIARAKSDVAGRTTYGYPFVSAIQRDNVYGVQFHPEKSHRFGLAVLRRFADL